MSTAALETLSEVGVYRQQAGMVRYVVHKNVEGLTQEESLLRPEPGGNCLNWVVGHLLNVYEQTLALLGQKPVMEEGALKRYARGTPPLKEAAEALDLRDLMAAWDQVAERIDAGLGGLTAEVLDQPAPHSPSNNPNETVRSLLTTIFFHQAYHAGQLGLLRRLAGKEGAIA